MPAGDCRPGALAAPRTRLSRGLYLNLRTKNCCSPYTTGAVSYKKHSNDGADRGAVCLQAQRLCWFIPDGHRDGMFGEFLVADIEQSLQIF